MVISTQRCLSCLSYFIVGVPDVKIQAHGEINLQESKLYSGPDLSVNNWSSLKTEVPNLDNVCSYTLDGEL